jgi:NADP-dependent 3-hydroxy acid dehydrogenase YdfG
MNLEYKTALVTGASSGIGLAIAKALLDKGCYVYGISRRGASIQHQHYTDLRADIGDYTQLEQALQPLLSSATNTDILINNAGLGYFGKIDDMKLEQWHEMFNTNVHGVFYCIKLLAPIMKKNRLGHIINISSIAGLQAVVEGSGYSATKYAVRAISQAIFRELRPFNVKVSTIFPGSVNTAFFDNIDHKLSYEDMIQPDEFVKSVIHMLESDDAYLPFELEVRTMRAK